MRGKGRNTAQQDTEGAGIGHNNAPPQISQAMVLELIEELDDADQEVATGVGHRKDVRLKAKGLGINLAALDRARKLATQSGEKREAEDRELRRYMAWMGKPLGHQAEMFDQTETARGNGIDTAAISEHQVHQVDTGGSVAGKAGHDRGSNPWSPGTYLYQIWDTGWMRGQEALAQTLVEEPKRRPGRPPGAKNKPKGNAGAAA